MRLRPKDLFREYFQRLGYRRPRQLQGQPRLDRTLVLSAGTLYGIQEMFNEALRNVSIREQSLYRLTVAM